MPTSWAEAGLKDRMLVTRRDNGDQYSVTIERNVYSCVAEGGSGAKVFLLCAPASDWWTDFRTEFSRKLLKMGDRIILVPSSVRAFFLAIENLLLN